MLAPSPAKFPDNVASSDADSCLFRSQSFSSTSPSFIISTSRNIVSSVMVMVKPAPWGAGESAGAKPSSSLSVDARAPDADPRSAAIGASGNTESGSRLCSRAFSSRLCFASKSWICSRKLSAEAGLCASGKRALANPGAAADAARADAPLDLADAPLDLAALALRRFACLRSADFTLRSLRTFEA